VTTIDEALEGSTPLAAKVKLRGPFESSREVVETMCEVATTLTEQEKIATLNAHPRIGEHSSNLSARSLLEQGADSLPELDRLNDEYERRFGFRFVVFVNRWPKSQIVEVLRQRLRRSRDEELETGMQAVIDIARDRLRR
jgi:2-oxo-4-hydroxy-4-carboxy--5-ureidoimidazoline (OHCU) decarboxylase